MEYTPYRNPEITRKQALAKSLAGIEMPTNNPLAALAAGIARGYGMASGAQADADEQQAYKDWQANLAQALSGASDTQGLARALASSGLGEQAIPLVAQSLNYTKQRADKLSDQQALFAHQEKLQEMKNAAAGAPGGGTSAEMQFLRQMADAQFGGDMNAAARAYGPALLANKSGMPGYMPAGVPVAGAGGTTAGVVPVPGSEKAMNVEEAQQAKQARAQQASDTATGMRAKAKEIKDIASRLSNVGPLRKFGQYVGEIMNFQDPTKLAAIVQEMKGGALVNELIRMKQQSPNGATGFGSLQKNEADAISATIGALDPYMLPELLIQQAEKIAKFFENAAAGRYITDDTGDQTPFVAKTAAGGASEDDVWAEQFLKQQGR